MLFIKKVHNLIWNRNINLIDGTLEVPALEVAEEAVKMYESDDIPEIYIDSKLLESSRNMWPGVDKRDSKNYEINGSVFFDVSFQDHWSYDEEILQFEIKYLSQNDEISEVDSVSYTKEIDDVTALIQVTPYGLIINSNILITENDWNTITGEIPPRCMACNAYVSDIADHIATEHHRKVLERCEPLQEFEFVVKKINDIYYCCICKITFQIKDMEHIESQKHGQLLLEALNRACDIMHNFDIHSHRNSDNGVRNKGNEVSRNRHDDSFYFNVNERACSGLSESVCSGDLDSSSDDGNDALFSYAAVAKKPKKSQASDIEIKLGDRTARVKFDCWNMIAVHKRCNEFYCMACKTPGPIRLKNDHCVELTHVENLMKCEIVGEYEEHVVRRVNDIHYHCGHCNNLQLMHEMRSHLETNHMKKQAIPNITVDQADLTKPKNSVKSKGNEHNESVTKDRNTSPVTNSTNDVRNIDNGNSSMNISEKHDNNIFNSNTLPSASLDISQDYDINVYNNTYRVSLLAFNFVQRRGMDCLCLLCQRTYNVAFIYHHIYHDPVHTNWMNQTRFWPQYSYNLIRHIACGFHCLTCDVFMVLDPAIHLREPMHFTLLMSALMRPQNANDFQIRTDGRLTNVDSSKLRVEDKKEIPKEIKLQQNPLELGVTSNDDRTKSKAQIITDIKDNIEIESNILTKKELENVKKDIAHKKHEATSKQNENPTDDLGNLNNEDKKINKNEDIPKDNAKTEKNITTKEESEIGNVNNVENKDQNDVNDIENGEIINVNNGVEKNAGREFDLDNGECNNTEEAEERISDSFVFVKLKKNCMKLTTTGYNTLVHVGNGSRLCLVCSSVVFNSIAHIESDCHLKNLENKKYLAEYERHLIRQISTTYHCAICNTVIMKKYLSEHLTWLPHIDGVTQSTKQYRQRDFKTQKPIMCSTQKEVTNTDPESTWKLLSNLTFTEKSVKRKKSVPDQRLKSRDGTPSKDGYSKVKKKNKIVRINDTVLKLTWDAYHGISKSKGGESCLICGVEFKSYELEAHVVTQGHSKALEDGFELEHAPALIRKVGNSLLHCLTCNTTTHSEQCTTHLKSKKHVQKQKEITLDSITVDSDADVLTLTSGDDKK